MNKRQRDLLEKAVVIAVDMDKTLCAGECWTIESCKNISPVTKMIKKINYLSLSKFIVIYTARRDHLIPATLGWLRRWGVQFHAISNNKTPADIYIDDKSISDVDFLEE